MVLIPARCAPSTFSFRPPIGNTLPRSVISPVMATSWRTGRPVISDASAVAMVTPAEGPSLGTAPAGTWMWMVAFCQASGGMPSLPESERTQVRAAWADSRMTSPSWPVRMRCSSLLCTLAASMKTISPPPTGV